MKDILENVQDALQAGLEYIRASDIYIADHEGIIPDHVRFPCIGIKDGAIKRGELTGSYLEENLTVKVAIYQRLVRDGAGVIGDGADKGVLEIEQDVHAILDEHLFDEDMGIESAFCRQSGESQTFGDDTEFIQRKILLYEYTREQLR
jgi:hypothetical protein